MLNAISFATVKFARYTLVNKSAGLLNDELNMNKIEDSNVSLF